MPVFWFALSQVNSINAYNSVMVFVILHLLVYPASNGYNSYMDRDTGSIGGIKDPKQPTRQLFYVSVLMDVIALMLSLLISKVFFCGILSFIAASRAYSYRGIRLKKYPVIGYLTVIFFQGAVIYFLVMHGCDVHQPVKISYTAMLGASLLVGGFYPLTQIYQHVQDKADGVTTLSYKLGYRGTFIFTAIIYLFSTTTLAWYFGNNLELDRFFLIQIFMLPVLVYFFRWFYKVWKNTASADFKHTMRMNLIASACTNAAFIALFLIEQF